MRSQAARECNRRERRVNGSLSTVGILSDELALALGDSLALMEWTPFPRGEPGRCPQDPNHLRRALIARTWRLRACQRRSRGGRPRSRRGGARKANAGSSSDDAGPGGERARFRSRPAHPGARVWWR